MEIAKTIHVSTGAHSETALLLPVLVAAMRFGGFKMDTSITFELPQSDIADPEPLEFLEEPTPPQREDYKLQENYDYAKREYEHKLSVYTARVQWRRERKAAEEAKVGIIYPEYSYFCPIVNDRTGDRAPFKPGMVAIWFYEHDHWKTDTTTDVLYYGDCKTGRWNSDGETVLKTIVSRMLGDYDREAHYRNILHTLKALSTTEVTFSRKIACENGILDLENFRF